MHVEWPTHFIAEKAGVPQALRTGRQPPHHTVDLWESHVCTCGILVDSPHLLQWGLQWGGDVPPPLLLLLLLGLFHSKVQPHQQFESLAFWSRMQGFLTLPPIWYRKGGRSKAPSPLQTALNLTLTSSSPRGKQIYPTLGLGKPVVGPASVAFPSGQGCTSIHPIILLFTGGQCTLHIQQLLIGTGDSSWETCCGWFSPRGCSSLAVPVHTVKLRGLLLPARTLPLSPKSLGTLRSWMNTVWSGFSSSTL